MTIWVRSSVEFDPEGALLQDGVVGGLVGRWEGERAGEKAGCRGT